MMLELVVALYELLKWSMVGFLILVALCGIYFFPGGPTPEDREWCDECRPKARHRQECPPEPAPLDYNQRWFEYNGLTYSGVRERVWDEFTRQCLLYEHWARTGALG